MLRDLLVAILGRLTPEQDRAWIGAYNFELVGGAESVWFEALGPTVKHAESPIPTLNAVIQDRWTEEAIDLFRRLGLSVDCNRRLLWRPGDPQPYVDRWQNAR